MTVRLRKQIYINIIRGDSLLPDIMFMHVIQTENNSIRITDINLRQRMGFVNKFF